MRAWAVETHMNISQEPFCVEIYKTNAGPPVNTSIEHRAFYSYRKIPFSVATLFGGKKETCLESHGAFAVFSTRTLHTLEPRPAEGIGKFESININPKTAPT